MENENRPRPEIIEEWFFPSPVYNREGQIVPAPPEALKKYDEAVGEGAELVSLFPVISLEKEGYAVQKCRIRGSDSK